MASTGARRFAVAFTAAAALIVPAVQNGLRLGLSQKAFAAEGDSTLRAEPFAFAIWGLIYLGVAAYAVFQARARERPLLARFGWPSAAAFLGIAAWIIAAAADQKALSVAVILAALIAALAPLLRVPPAGAETAGERWLVIVPNALLAGWLTVASALNIVTVLTALGRVPASAADAWAMGAIAVTGVAGLAIAVRANVAACLLPIAWGLFGVHVAAHADGRGAVAMTAIAAAGLLVLAALAIVLRKRRA